MQAVRLDINYLGPLLLHCKVEQEKNFYLKWLGEEPRSSFVVNGTMETHINNVITVNIS